MTDDEFKNAVCLSIGKLIASVERLESQQAEQVKDRERRDKYDGQVIRQAIVDVGRVIVGELSRNRVTVAEAIDRATAGVREVLKPVPVAAAPRKKAVPVKRPDLVPAKPVEERVFPSRTAKDGTKPKKKKRKDKPGKK